MHEFHDNCLVGGGHLGFQKTYQKMRQRYYTRVVRSRVVRSNIDVLAGCGGSREI